jgi:ubiquinone/menaquinone biosynthesis C-methylase UbiE
MTENFDLSIEQAHAYEDLFVPALFAQWVPTLLNHAGVTAGQRVLDVACGTGVVARQAAEIVGQAGAVTGVDLNPAMLEVAKERASAIHWRIGDAVDLPFENSTFDVVLCQSALFFFGDPARAVKEMARVVRVGGVVALQTYAGLDQQPAYGPFVETVARLAGDDARELMGTYWSQGDLGELRSLVERAGFATTVADNELGHVRFPSIDAFVHTEIQATPLAARIDDATTLGILGETRQALAEYEQRDGSVDLPIRACFVAGDKA